MRNPRGFSPNPKRTSRKIRGVGLQETEDGAQVQSTKITPKTWFIPEQFHIGRFFAAELLAFFKLRTLSTQPASYSVSRSGFKKVMESAAGTSRSRIGRSNTSLWRCFYQSVMPVMPVMPLRNCLSVGRLMTWKCILNTQECTFRGSEVWKKTYQISREGTSGSHEVFTNLSCGSQCSVYTFIYTLDF